LRIAGEVAAGRPYAGSVEPGEAARIFTGGVVPPGADTIVIQENTTRDGDRVIVREPSPPGRHVRRAGLDFSSGQVLLRKGRRLTDRDVMLAAAMNHPGVPVHRRPAVAVLATGDELRPPGSALGPGEIVYSNGFALMALASAEGAAAIDLGVVPDRVDATVEAIRKARTSGADILVTTGGASVGDYDLVQRGACGRGTGFVVLAGGTASGTADDERTARRDARSRPAGKPGVGLRLRAPVSGAADPPAVGRSDVAPQTESAVLGCDLAANDERADYLRATLPKVRAARMSRPPYPCRIRR
jgi:molybdopterin molybdotransferase